jgi:Peptidase family M20/M25/M40
MSFTRLWLVLALFTGTVAAQSSQPNWAQLEAETMRHFQAILRLDSSDPPGYEAPVVEYLKSVLDKEGIETKVFALDPKRPNLVARLRGNGKKRPILIMGHTDVVSVDPAKWKHPPFSATREGGYVYGRGTIDDKDNVVACLMVIQIWPTCGRTACNVMELARWLTSKTAQKASARIAIRSAFSKNRCTSLSAFIGIS